MTEDYKLPVLITFCKVSDLKLLYVCEERSDENLRLLSEVSEKIFKELHEQKISPFLEQSEKEMFQPYGKLF